MGASGRARAVRLPADDERLDVVPAVAVGGSRDALLELSEEVGQETGGAVLALTREGAEEERPAPCGHAPHIAPREHRGIVVPIRIVETEELGPIELEPGDAPSARLEWAPDLIERAHPHRNDYRGDCGGADAAARRHSASTRFMSPMIST